MTKREIVKILEDIAVLLELKGENAFKIRAYQSGARALDGLEKPLEEVIAAGELAAVKGLGKALVEKVTTLHATGALPYYETLRASVAPGLLELLEIPGFGPKKIKKVNEALGVEDIAGLVAACESGALAELAGFGAKSAENILRGIRNREAYGKRHLWADAEAVARPILEGLRSLPQVVRAEAAGSLRRGKETVGDLDFIVASASPGPIMDWFVGMAGVEEVTAHGETKSSVRLAGGLQADLRVVPDARYVFALHHFTGSKEHNVKLRQRALARGYSMSEWGLFAKDAADEGLKGAERALAVEGIADEADLFRALGLNYVPPSLREGLDELEMAERGEFGRFVELADLRGVFHNHTTASDGSASLEAMAQGAAARGWEYIGIADHSKASYQANGLDAERLLAQVAAIRALNARGDLPRIYAGCEVDILKDGTLDFDKTVLSQLDYCVLSVHGSMSGMDEQAMTARIVRALETDTGCLKMLGHLTGRLLLKREGYAVHVPTVIAAAAANGVCIELNASPQRLDMDWRWWPQAVAAGVLCVINPDAHSVEGLDSVRYGIVSAQKGRLRPEAVLNCRGLAQLGDLRGV